ncbi:biotin-dependent carboxyltransferase family protein [Herbiconiux sp.]|uniref:5-oxoprolinase subunit C family protein n=1 Tax=Herbiconiux sp. TaxID=1871186 RepID=UPI0025B8FE21|nr:biotin-dependent carboxyltransferase family protein [Herbiconiux sp.]
MQDEPAFDILATGPLSLLEDDGRAGWAHLGVTASGAADRGAYRAANRLVGNRPGAACIETVLGGLTVRARRTLLVATAGAGASVTVRPGPAPSTSTGTASSASARRLVDNDTLRGRHAAPAGEEGGHALLERHHPPGHSLTLFSGDVLTVEQPAAGLRTYVAVRGGFDAVRVLGSRSSDVLSGLGPAALRPGDVLQLADDAGEWPAADFVRPPIAPLPLRLRRGPRDDWFGDQGWAALLETTWTVSADSNRVGVRLESPDGVARLAPFAHRELASEGMVAGAIQIPPSGLPVIFLRDHPVTGGYPVIAVLTDTAIDAASQLRPGDPARFTDQR